LRITLNHGAEIEPIYVLSRTIIPKTANPGIDPAC
jgi:hypothetical protein